MNHKGRKRKSETNFQKQFFMINAHLVIIDYWFSGLKLENPQITSFCFSGYSTPLYLNYRSQITQDKILRETLNLWPSQGVAGCQQNMHCLPLQQSVRRADSVRSMQAERLMNLGMLRVVENPSEPPFIP